MMTRSLDGAVYNEVVDAWMIPQAAPFSLAEFQAAYDKLAAGKSTQTLSKSLAAEFAPAKKLAPTHYALKIYPKTEEEQWRMEMMKDVHVSYIPFDWVQLTSDEAGKVEQSKTRSAANTFAEKSPYTVTYEYTHATDGGATGPRTFRLPILYTMWPASKPLPENLEYVVDYEAFMPIAALDKQLSSVAMQGVMNEMAPVSRADPRTSPSLAPLATYSYYGNLSTYDSTVSKNVPIANLKVKHQNALGIWETVTDSTGDFNLIISDNNPIPYVGLPVTLTYQDPTGRWKITNDSYDFIPLTSGEIIVFNRVSTNYFLSVSTLLSSSSHQENEIHRAVNYFFNNQSIFTKPNRQGGITIFGLSIGNPNVGGEFWFNPNYSAEPLVQIYNNGTLHGEVIGNTLHELGHYAHYWGVRPELGYASYYMAQTEILLVESFGLYSGWYLGEEYYLSRGRSQYSGSLDITGNGRQTWTNTLTSPYSPLFIDLTDTYNQSSFDTFQNLAPANVWYTITHSKTWADCKNMLNSFYPNNQLTAYFDYYDDWFKN